MGDTAKSIIDFVKEFIDEGRARANSRWFSVFILSWLTFNWKRVTEIVFCDERTPDTIQTTISTMLVLGTETKLDVCTVATIVGLYLTIIAWCAFWIYGKPYIDLKTTEWQHNLKKRIRATELETTMKKENMDVHEYFMNQETLENEYKNKIYELNQENEKLKEEVSKCDILTKEVTNENVIEMTKNIYMNLYRILSKSIVIEEKRNNHDLVKKYERDAKNAQMHIDKYLDIAEKYYK